MANTVTQRTLLGDKNSRLCVRQITIVSDGTQESGLVIYDNSAFRDNPNKGSLIRLQATGSDCVCKLEWKQTTNAPILTINPALTVDFQESVGISNPGGTGATGDIVLSTVGLAATEAVTLIITVVQ